LTERCCTIADSRWTQIPRNRNKPGDGHRLRDMLVRCVRVLRRSLLAGLVAAAARRQTRLSALLRSVVRACAIRGRGKLIAAGSARPRRGQLAPDGEGGEAVAAASTWSRSPEARQASRRRACAAFLLCKILWGDICGRVSPCGPAACRLGARPPFTLDRPRPRWSR
jgi:hypothetical protein